VVFAAVVILGLSDWLVEGDGVTVVDVFGLGALDVLVVVSETVVDVDSMIGTSTSQESVIAIVNTRNNANRMTLFLSLTVMRSPPPYDNHLIKINRVA